jgi:hypothetical protein
MHGPGSYWAASNSFIRRLAHTQRLRLVLILWGPRKDFQVLQLIHSTILASVFQQSTVPMPPTEYSRNKIQFAQIDDWSIFVGLSETGKLEE